MSRYINADALITAMNTWDWQDLYLPIHFKQLIDEQPTADVVEVVHGEWKKGVGENGVTTSIFCSRCHCENKYWYNWNFCPNCGADMRGGTE